MRKLLALTLLAACAGPAQQVQRPAPPGPPAPPPPPPPAHVVQDNARIDYRAQAEGKALIEVAAPPGAQVEVREADRLLARDVAPMAVGAEADHWYRIAARLPSGAVRDLRVQARSGQVASLRFEDDAPRGPQAMSRAEFKDLLRAVDTSSGDTAKLAVVRSAARNNFFTTDMVSVLLDHVVYRDDKLQLIPLLKDRILDRENEYRLYQHFTYREDKAKVQEMLER